MKDRLEKFISENRNAFDDKEPSQKVWNGIEGSLPAKHVSLWGSVTIWRAAAIVLFGLSAYLFLSREPARAVSQKELSKNDGDFHEQESYYNSQITEKMSLINNYDAAEVDLFTQDYKKLDAMYQVLGEEMKLHPDKKVKDAMILNLLVRVDLLNQQLKRLEDKRPKKSPAPSEV